VVRNGHSICFKLIEIVIGLKSARLIDLKKLKPVIISRSSDHRNYIKTKSILQSNGHVHGNQSISISPFCSVITTVFQKWQSVAEALLQNKQGN
jgi:hypothetical protein